MANKRYTVCVATASLRGEPEQSDIISNNDSQLLFGETFEVERQDGEWLYGISSVDDYTGYVHKNDLRLKKSETTHAFTQVSGHLYSTPSFKSAPAFSLPFMARLSIDESDAQNGFVHAPDYGWVFEKHITPLSSLKLQKDFTQAAMMFLGAPYLYGGRSANGIDCSGLVQIALSRASIPCPRDTAQQIMLGSSINQDDIKHGDLVFFKGHVGIMLDKENILNATSRTMDTRVESLSELEKIYHGIIDIRRMPV